MSAESGTASSVAPPGSMCDGASTCVAVCDPKEISETSLESPRAIDEASETAIGGFPGYIAPPVRMGRETS